MADYREWDRLVNLFRPSSKSPNIAKAFDQAKKHSVRQDVELTALAALLANQSPPPPVGGGALGVDRATMLATGGTILREDNSAASDPLPGLWGELLAVSSARHVHKTSGGDTRTKANGVAQGNTNYRELTVVDGDDFFGERCQVGRNEWRYGENAGAATDGTFALAHEGERKITFWSMRFPSGFPMSTGGWQQIGQWKQTQPYSDANCATRNVDGNGVTMEVQLYSNQLRLLTWWQERWTTAVPPTGQWIRFALDITFSQWNEIGKIQFFVDNDGDGDFLDADEMSPVFDGATLLYVTTAHSGMAVGDSVPSCFETGIYHNPPSYGTTTLDIDNIQVMG